MIDKPENILDIHRFRFACKEFDKGKKISAENLNLILEVGRLSPSSFGFEPWKFLVIENEMIKDKISKYTWGLLRQMHGLSELIVILARKKPDMIYNSKYIRYMIEEVQKTPDDMKNARLDRYKNFLEHDFELLENDRYIFDWACKQTYIALANMMTTAAQLGVDSCPIEGFHREKLETWLEKCGILDRENYGISVMLALGYRKENPTRQKTRKSFEEVVERIR